MTMKTYLPLLLLLPCIFATQESSAPVPVAVENEPLHHVVLKNDSIVVLHLTLPPGVRTLYHTHTHDRVAVNLSTTSITQQTLGENEGPASPSAPGNISVYTLAGNSFTHRVHNIGSSPFDVIDIELLHRPETPSPTAAAAIAGENPSARVYNWPLAPGSVTPMHTHTRPYLILSATAFNLKMTAPDGQSNQHEINPGDFHWVNTQVTHTLANTGNTPGQIVEIELK
jgi:quercetin dioxygenase-like cupin family protein